jgi:Flp pilus assembly protein TadG
MTRLGDCSKSISLLGRFSRNADGVSAVEFAILLPLMVTLYIGAVEVGDGTAIQFKTTLAAKTVANLAAQYTVIPNTTTMSNILNAATSVIAPYSSTGVSVTVSEVTTDANGAATVSWSCAANGNAHTVGQSVTLPNGVQTPNISVIWGEVNYPYTPQLGYVVTGTINIYQNTYFYPRLSSSVPFQSSCP